MVGQFVRSKAGHDKDTVYVVIAEEGDFVMLCDGRLKPLANPKKKRRKHVQPMCETVARDILEALKNGTVCDEQIKYAIKQRVGGNVCLKVM